MSIEAKFSPLSLLLICLTSFTLTACVSAVTPSNQTQDVQVDANAKPIYGTDNRVELLHAGRALCHVGRSVPALFSRDKLARHPNNFWTLETKAKLTDHGWCPGQRFASQIE